MDKILTKEKKEKIRKNKEKITKERKKERKKESEKMKVWMLISSRYVTLIKVGDFNGSTEHFQQFIMQSYATIFGSQSSTYPFST